MSSTLVKSLLIYLLMTLPAIAETLDDLVVRDGLLYKKFTDVPFSGEIEGKASGKLKNGKWHGRRLYFYSNGQLAERANYNNGLLEGKSTSYNENGTIWLEGEYLNNKKQGLWKISNANGKLLKHKTYKDGVLTGTYASFYLNGNTSQTGQCSLGKREGKWESFHENGKIRRMGMYRNDLKEGEWLTYDESGTLFSSKVYLNGKTNDELTIYEMLDDSPSYPPCSE